MREHYARGLLVGVGAACVGLVSWCGGSMRAGLLCVGASRVGLVGCCGGKSVGGWVVGWCGGSSVGGWLCGQYARRVAVWAVCAWLVGVGALCAWVIGWRGGVCAWLVWTVCWEGGRVIGVWGWWSCDRRVGMVVV